jgi:two-component system KDP operon response regulator KdpE
LDHRHQFPLSGTAPEAALLPDLGHVLIVEDDPTAAFVLTAALRFGGFGCDVAPTAGDALALIRGRKYDTVLLDLGLPDLDGYQLMKALRFHIDVPIIVVSGHDTEEEKVAALDAGADDFVAKPYAPSELLARIRAVLRRHAAQEHRHQEFTHQAAEAEKPEPVQPALATTDFLRPDEQLLLDVLLAASGKVVSVHDLILKLWQPGQAGGVDKLRTLVHGLRRKLKAHRVPVAISNQRGTGYRALQDESNGRQTASYGD